MYGVNPTTLRAWERRYGLVTPVRGEGGHRGFTAEDLDRIRQMVELTRAGISASAAAEQVKSARGRASSKTPPGLARLRTQFALAAERLAAEKLAQLCNDADSAIGYRNTVEQLCFPELTRIAGPWEENSLVIAQEHCASLATRTYLSRRYLEFSGQAGRNSRSLPVVALACVPNELHDLPLLHLANVLLESARARPVVLAAGLPLEVTLGVAENLSARVLLLSATMQPTAAQTREWMDTITRAGWEKRCLLAGSGFNKSRIFSETKVRAAAGSYSHVADLIAAMAQKEPTPAARGK